MPPAQTPSPHSGQPLPYRTENQEKRQNKPLPPISKNTQESGACPGISETCLPEKRFCASRDPARLSPRESFPLRKNIASDVTIYTYFKPRKTRKARKACAQISFIPCFPCFPWLNFHLSPVKESGYLTIISSDPSPFPSLFPFYSFFRSFIRSFPFMMLPALLLFYLNPSDCLFAFLPFFPFNPTSPGGRATPLFQPEPHQSFRACPERTLLLREVLWSENKIILCPPDCHYLPKIIFYRIAIIYCLV